MTAGATTTPVPVAAARTAPGLHWGLKRSFLRYVARTPDGRCSVTDGAEIDVDGCYHFAGADDLASAAEHRLRGDLRFVAHRGMLSVRIADPWLRLDGDEGVLSALVGTADPVQRVVLATFVRTPDAGARGWRGTQVRLTAEATAVFNAFYPAGEPLDDLVWMP